MSFISFDVHFARREANSLADRCVSQLSQYGQNWPSPSEKRHYDGGYAPCSSI
jgi:hypothetical protein